MLRARSISNTPSISSRFSEEEMGSIDRVIQESDREEKIQTVRAKIVRILEDRLRIQSLSEGRPMDENITKMAKGLEQLLFQSSPSAVNHCDLATLDNRIRLLLTVTIQRRLNKSSKRNRSYVLRKTLGKQKYLHVQNLVAEIRLQKNKKVATMKCCSSSVCSLPFRKTLPQPVRDLFFDTALLDAFERSPLENADKVNWDGLVSNAEENLQAYHNWAGTN